MKRCAVVTGGGSGVGAAVALALAKADWTVVITGRRQAALDATCSLGGGAIHAISADISDQDAVADLFAEVADRFGRIDLLFNNAGLFPPPSPVQDVTLEDWTHVMDVNLTGAFLCAQQAFRQMIRQSPQGGRIINNGSLSAQVPRPHAISYTVSKHAITGLTRALALEGRPYGIACGQIDIGNAATALTAGLAASAMQADGSMAAEPMMDVNNVAASVVHMASLPLEANVQFMTVMATRMPFIGRG